MPNEVKLLPCEELVESVKQSLEDVFYDTLNCAFDADLLARAAIEAMSRPTTVVTDEVVEPRNVLNALRHWFIGYKANGGRADEEIALIDSSLASMPTVVTGEQPQDLGDYALPPSGLSPCGSQAKPAAAIASSTKEK